MALNSSRLGHDKLGPERVIVVRPLYNVEKGVRGFEIK